MSNKLTLESEFHDMPMLSEADRLISLMNRLSIFPAVQTNPRGGAEATGLRIKELYGQVAELPMSGSRRELSCKRQVSVLRSKELLTGLVSIGLINRPERPDVAYYYQPADDGAVDYAALVNPYDDINMVLKTAEEIGPYQAEMALSLALQASQIENLKVRHHPVKH